MIIHCDSTRYIWEVLENNEYSFWKDGQVVVDLGCNIGAFSLSVQPFAKHICAIDCDLTKIDLFKNTIKDNGYQNITTFNLKMGGEDTQKEQTLGEFLIGQDIKKVDILKIDIEGDELPVLQATNFPANKVRLIIGEYHYDDGRVSIFKDQLKFLGYDYTEYPNKHFLARLK